MWKIRFICWSGSSIDLASIRTMASKDAGNAARNSSSKGKGPAKSPTLASKLRNKVDESKVADIEECWSPASWSEVLENICTMRAARNAPVDSMGAEVFMKDPGATDPKAGRLHVLVSLMLSSQTRDEVNHAAMTPLREAGLSVPWLRAVPEPELAQLVKPVGFWRRKAQYLKAAAELLKSEFDGDIPAAISDLCRLPGVGPKMAHLAMNIAWRQICGIGVDTHVHRISNRLGWTRRSTANPEQTRLELEAWLPQEHWAEINLLMVGLGQQLCTPVAPRCGDCLNRSLCPSAAAGSPAKRPAGSPTKKLRR